MISTANERVQAAIAHLEEVQRARGEFSQQPRFAPRNTQATFSSVYRWIRQADLEEPPYTTDSRKRDKWLSEFWRKENHLAGVINSVVAIDKNRGWSLIGGRNQVKRYTDILRSVEAGQGWRYYMTQQAQMYYTTDLGALTEIGRDGPNGPLRALYTLDSTKCYLTGKPTTPLAYEGTKDPWRPEDFFRVTSLASFREDQRGLGFCAVSRCLEMAKIMIAVYQHDQEMLGARAPKGLLLLKGVGQEQWNTAMAARTEELNAREQEWFGSVAVLASETDDVDAKLFALSQLPAGFDIEVTTKLIMYAYALAFGYDPIEFWPVEAGSLGRGKETEIQHQKATGKGAADFMLGFQDRLQMQLPETLSFEFEERDQQGMLLEASVIQAWANVANALYQSGMGILTREQAASLLVEQGILPAEWTEIEEDVMSTDESTARLHAIRQRALENESVRRAAALYPHEPIVRYSWPQHRTTVLWERGDEILRRRVWQVVSEVPRALPAPVQRQDEGEILFEGDDFTITQADVEQAIEDGRRRVGDEFAELLTARTLTDEELEQLDE